MKRQLVIGVDVGGTFTDLFFLDEATGRSWIGKVPSTRGREADGFLKGIREGAEDLAHVATVVHGTTVGTNALLERKGGRTGIIATEGFRDVLEMRRRDRPQTWGLWGQFEPVVPRGRRLEVRERVLADGTIRTEVDPAEVTARARELLALGVEAVAVTFVNAYANGQNEQAAAKALKAVWPNAYVNVSSEILPEIREFERTSTTVLNAYLQPVVADYLDRLEADLAAQGFAGQLLIVQSNGGVMTIEIAKARPVRTALSGPAAGVIAAAHIAETAGFPNIVTGDVGGTSFDVSLIAGGKTTLAAQTSIDFGLVVRTPMIEITTIGAGGGSIASVDRGGLLQVGPESAGAVPGPVCYGQGNDRPTLTDANVVLGRINAERPIGGGLKRLEVEAARAAIEKHVGKPLGLDATSAAEAIVRVANSRMAGAIRLVSIERGHNPRDFALMPFGGGGGLHAGALMQEVGLKAALIPPYPGVTSALGCVIADMRHDFVQTVNRTLEEIDFAAIDAEIARLVDEGGRLLDRSGVSFTSRDTLVACDMLYLGQTHTVATPIPWRKGELHATTLRQSFEQRYREVYGRLLDGIPIRVLNIHVALIGRRPKLDLSTLAPSGGSLEAAKLGRRQVYFGGKWREATVYARHELPVGASIGGPAILEQPDATIMVEPELQAHVDHFGNIIIERQNPMINFSKPDTVALMLVDLQNDFLHPNGAYARGKATSASIAELPSRLKPVADCVRAGGGWIVSTHFTLVPGRGGEPLISPHLAALRPFLRKGDFAPGGWGHGLVDALQPADLSVEKVAFSAFYMSRLEWILRKAGIETLVFSGIVTNGGVASTLRDAHVRDFTTVLLEDGCAAFSDDTHRTNVAALRSVADVMTCADFIAAFQARR